MTAFLARLSAAVRAWARALTLRAVFLLLARYAVAWLIVRALQLYAPHWLTALLCVSAGLGVVAMLREAAAARTRRRLRALNIARAYHAARTREEGTRP